MTGPHFETLYELARKIMRDCPHPGPRDAEMKMPDGTTAKACWRCGNDAGAAYRQARKLQLAARPLDCDRCGTKPHTFRLAGFRLCGRCLRLTEQEHYRNQANAGTLAIFATSLLVDTRTWAGRRGAVAEGRVAVEGEGRTA